MIDLKALRKKHGYKSARAFAEAIGMDTIIYTNTEQGRRRIDLDMLAKMSRTLGVSCDELLGVAPASDDLKWQEIGQIYAVLNDDGRRLLLTLARGLIDQEVLQAAKEYLDETLLQE